jgi:hypothetical protein
MHLVSGLFLLFSPIVRGAILDVGVLSFDVLIPGVPGSPGINVFDISNLTGDPSSGGFALPPDFPAFTPLTLLSSKLTLIGAGSSQTIDLGDIAPGPFGSTGPLQFPDTVLFSSAIFSATLSTSHILLSDGSAFIAPSTSINSVLLPSAGLSLLANTDFAIIAVTNVPEPTTFSVVLSGLAAIVGFAIKAWLTCHFPFRRSVR